jgi:polygalacturonase
MSLKKYIVITFCSLLPVFVMAKDYPASLFGIRSDGVTLNTRSIQFGIDYISQNGGGRLVFSVGRYLSGSVYLKSNVTIQLEEGAVLLGSLNPFDYDRKIFMAFIFAFDVHDIGISGKGIIEGQGRPVAGNVMDLIHRGIIKDVLRNDRPAEGNRPMLINFRNCENVRLGGVTLRNAACWVQTYDQCKNVVLDSVRVDSRAYWNNDGIDIVDCDSVTVSNCYIDAADDGICLKSHDAKMVCRNIWIHGNTIRSSANAIKFGTASYGGFSNIHIIHNKIYNTYRSAIALEAVDGGFIEKVEIDSLEAVHTGNAIFLRIGEHVSGKKGRLENIRIDHVSVEIATGKPDSGYEYEGPVEDMPRNISPGVIIAGMPDASISHITIKNIKKDYRTVVVLDDVHESKFDVRGLDSKKAFYMVRCSGIGY